MLVGRNGMQDCVINAEKDPIIDNGHDVNVVRVIFSWEVAGING